MPNRTGSPTEPTIAEDGDVAVLQAPHPEECPGCSACGRRLLVEMEAARPGASFRPLVAEVSVAAVRPRRDGHTTVVLSDVGSDDAGTMEDVVLHLRADHARSFAAGDRLRVVICAPPPEPGG